MTLQALPSQSFCRLSPSTLVIALSICTGLVACGSGGGDSASPIGSQPPPPHQYAYVASQIDDKIHIYSVNPSTGQLTASGTVDTGRAPTQIAFTSDHRFAYVINNSSHDVSAYTLNKATGELRSNGLPILTGGLSPASVAVDPLGRFVYVANQNSGTGAGVSAFRIKPDGTLETIGSVQAPNEPFSVSVDPTGRFVYVASGDPPTSPPTPIHNWVYSFSINSDGSLSSIPGSPTPAPEVAVHVLVHPSFPSISAVYVASGTSSMVTAYHANANGLLTKIDPPGSLSTGGVGARAVAVGNTREFAYAVNISTNDVSTFHINPTTGALTPVGSPTPLPIPIGGTKDGNEGARWVAAHPSAPFLYVTYLTNSPPHTDPNHIPAHVAAFRINPANGALIHIGDTPTGDMSVGITVINTP